MRLLEMLRLRSQKLWVRLRIRLPVGPRGLALVAHKAETTHALATPFPSRRFAKTVVRLAAMRSLSEAVGLLCGLETSRCSRDLTVAACGCSPAASFGDLTSDAVAAASLAGLAGAAVPAFSGKAAVLLPEDKTVDVLGRRVTAPAV